MDYLLPLNKFWPKPFKLSSGQDIQNRFTDFFSNKMRFLILQIIEWQISIFYAIEYSQLLQYILPNIEKTGLFIKSLGL